MINNGETMDYSWLKLFYNEGEIIEYLTSTGPIMSLGSKQLPPNRQIFLGVENLKPKKCGCWADKKGEIYSTWNVFFFEEKTGLVWQQKWGYNQRRLRTKKKPFSGQLFICLLCLSWSHVSLRFVARNPLILKHGKKWCWYIEIYIYIYNI